MSLAERNPSSLSGARTLITSVCRLLQASRSLKPAVRREYYAASADCYVLLNDATKIFCQAVSEQYGEAENKRWSPVLPELLLSHPDKCGETLALLESKELKEISYFQFVAA